MFVVHADWNVGGAAYEERARLASADPTHEYLVEERPGPVSPMREYRIVKRPAVRP
jgi:hypothetical protein